MKLKKKITKQNRNAKKLLPPSNLYFSRCLNLLDEFEWYFACFLDKFSKMNKAKINNNKKNESLFANARSSNVIHELYIPVVRVFIEKKSTAPNSAKVSIATNDNPATIAGLADGKITFKKAIILENPKFLLRSIKYWDWYKKEALAKMYT